MVLKLMSSQPETESKLTEKTGALPFPTETLVTALVVALVTIIAFVAYIPTFSAPPMLDEQFLLSWLEHLSASSGPSSWGTFVLGAGLDRRDCWGPLTTLSLLASHAVFGTTTWAYHAAGILTHALTCVCLLFVVREIAGERIPRISAATAFLFALYPLNPEAVSWIGGRGAQLSTLFFLASFYCYLRLAAHERKGEPVHEEPGNGTSGSAHQGSGFLLMAGGLALFLSSLAASWSSWTGAFVLAAYEAIWRLTCAHEKETLKSSLSRLAPFLLLAAAYTAVGQTFMLQHPALPQPATPESVWKVVQNMVLPINQAIWHGYGKEYRFLYFFLTPLLVALPVALFKDASLRRVFAFAAFWLFIAIVPAMGSAVQDSSLYGSRWLYAASVPWCLLLACLTFSFLSLAKRFQWPLNLVSTVVTVVLLVFFFRHLWNQTSAYRVGGKVLASIQQSMRMVVDKEKDTLVIARDVPDFVAIVPAFSVKGAPAFDGETGLLAAASLPGGRLKDELRRGRHVATALRWDKNFASLLPYELVPPKTEFQGHLDVTGVTDRLRPALPYLQTVKLDAPGNCLVLERNSYAGPAVGLRGEEFSTIDGDFLYVDAMIDTPGQPQHPTMEVHWMTSLHNDFDNKERKVAARVTVNDGKYHRYYLPLRTIGWTTNGRIGQINLGFPSGAKCRLKGMGVIAGEERMPSLTVAAGQEGDRSLWRFDLPFANFPTDLPLGLYAAPPEQKMLALDYSAERIAGGAGALLEVSRPDKPFDNPNADELSAVTLKTIPAKGVKGRIDFDLSSLPAAGNYAVRVIATDGAGNMLGNFSDCIRIQVRR